MREAHGYTNVFAQNLYTIKKRDTMNWRGRKKKRKIPTDILIHIHNIHIYLFIHTHTNTNKYTHSLTYINTHTRRDTLDATNVNFCNVW